ncbi:MAG: S41 family peptidase [Planctomycetia bacterium]|nr:S41 family peptidase [Planctomycetia bacterium]
MPRRNAVWILGILLLSIAAWTAAQGGLIPPRGPMQFVKGFTSQGKDYENLALMIDVMQHIDMNYVRDLKPAERRKFIEAAIDGGLASLDPNSSYISPKEYTHFKKQSEGKFGGIGVQVVVNRDTKRVMVITPIMGTPAYRAGIKPGDEIEAINGEKAQGLSNDDVVDRISGSPGTTVTLTIRRRGSGRRMEITLTREEITTEGILGDKRKPDQNWDFFVDAGRQFGYIRIASFGSNSLETLTKALQELQKDHAQGLILDLRNNPGGSLETAVSMADLFIDSGEIVRVEGRNEEPRIYQAKKEGTFFTGSNAIPIVVLVNEMSASASEIVASSLQDHKRAVVIGDRSFGKGSVQRLYPMEAGTSRLRLTTAKYLRPSGKNIHKFPDSKEQDDWGVRPDIEVKLSPLEELDWLIARRDRDIIRDEESSRMDQVEKITTMFGPLSMMPGWSGAAGAIAGLAETANTMSALNRSTRPYQDKVLEKALEYLKAHTRESRTT